MTSSATATPAAPAAPTAPAEPAEADSLPRQLARFSERFGHMMSRIVLTLLYAVLVAPVAALMAPFFDPLRIRRWSGSSWVRWTQDNDTLERARRQD